MSHQTTVACVAYKSPSDDHSVDDSIADPDYVLISDVETDEHDVQNYDHNMPQIMQQNKGKKRKLKPELGARTVRKKKRNSGEEYVNIQGVTIPKKCPILTSHKCRFTCCDNISVEKRKELFDKFWELGSWETQTMFLMSCIKSFDPQRRNRDIPKNRACRNIFYFDKYRVCCKFLTQTLAISDGRLHRALRRKSNDHCDVTTVASPKDLRGKHANHVAVPHQLLNDVQNHINAFSKYQSHYTRNRSTAHTYLNHGVTLSVMYQMYFE